MLYIVATPIGNLEDLSIRQAKILAQADYILTEDTRSTGLLLKQITKLFSFSINSLQKLISYYKEKEMEKLPLIIEWLKISKNVALISQAGLPLISDPGYLLTKTIINQQIPFTVIPGPSALTNALILSGFKTNSFIFLGFLPKKHGQINQLINQLKSDYLIKNTVIIFYESPIRIKATLNILSEIVPQASIAICREMTKKFEEVIRGHPEELSKRQYKGELTVVVKL